MAKGASEAYDLSLFEPTAPRLRAVNSPEKTAALQEKKERREKRAHMIMNGFIVTLLVVALALMIVSRVQLTELNDQISASEEELAILNSETSRLTNELASKTSAESVDQYAQENGMQKVESYQIEYITVDGGDKIEVAEDASGGIFAKIAGVIVGWFGE